MNGEIGLHATPMVAKNVVIVGAAGKTGANPKSFQNVKGFVRGFDVRTGKRLWIFHTIPQQGEFGNDTWEKESWVYTGNTGVWAQISIDEELGLVYLPVEMPTGDYYGGHRPGERPVRRKPRRRRSADRQAQVALSTRSPRHLGHRHSLRADSCRHHRQRPRGEGRRAADQAGVLYVFDRVTGKPIWPIEERPVAQGDVPGEWYSPTQPFPTKPPPLRAQGRVGRRPDRLHAGAARRSRRPWSKKYAMGPMFTPPVVSKVEGPLALLTRALAGTNWQGGSYDPETHIAYVYFDRRHRHDGARPAARRGSPTCAYISGNAIAGARLTGGSGSSAGGGRSVAGGAATRAAAAEADAGGGLSIRACRSASRRTAGSARSTSTRAKSAGRSRTARRPTTSRSIPRSRA